MSFDRLFTITSYLLYLLSFGMLAMTGRLGLTSHLLCFTSIIVGYLIDTGKLQWSLSNKAANRLAIARLCLSVIEWKVLGEFPIAIILNYIIFVSALKLIRRKTHRDWLWLYMISFCQVLMCAGMTAGSTFLLIFIVYIFVAIAALICCEIKRRQVTYDTVDIVTNESSESRAKVKYFITPQVKENDTGIGTKSFAAVRMLTSSGVILALIIGFSVPLFLVMPRLNPRYSRSGYLPTEKLSGFSDTVKFGDLGRIKLNPVIVMRVRVKFPNENERSNLRWRGVTLDYYDGEGWKQSNIGSTIFHREGETFRVGNKSREGEYTVQQFFLEPLDINTVFVAPTPVYVTGLPDLIRDGGDGLWTEYHPYNKIEYRVVSDTSVPTDKELATNDFAIYNKDISKRYLQLPNDFDKRIQRLSSQITTNATTKIEVARKIEQYLKTHYSYSLNQQRVDYGDPVADFLLNTKEGHCEYFASAMTLMLRAQKIPARLVNGFQTGEYNQSADVYTVRQSDAHSWVEVYFQNHGWIAFDPTPGGGQNTYEDDWTAWLRKQSEAMEMFWLENIVGFDAGKQISIAMQIQNWLSTGKGNSWLDKTSDFASFFESSKNNNSKKSGDTQIESINPSFSATISLILFISSIVSLFIFGSYAVKNRRMRAWKRIALNDPTHSAAILYMEMLNILGRRGITKTPSTTPAEFADGISIPAVSKITSFYHSVRFGNKIPSQDELNDIETELKLLKK